MARALYDARVAGPVVSLFPIGTRQLLTLPVDANGDTTNLTVNVFADADGSTPVTDLLAEDGTTPITQLTIAAGSATLPRFYGPDGYVAQLWLEDPDGSDFYPVSVDASAAAEQTAVDRAAAEEALAALQGVADTNDGIMTLVAQDEDSDFRAELDELIPDAVPSATPKVAGTLQLNEDPANPTTGIAVIDGYQRQEATGYEARRQWDLMMDAELDAQHFTMPKNFDLTTSALVTLTADEHSTVTLDNVTGMTGSIMGSHLIGLLVSGPNITPGTTVLNCTATAITLSTAATGTASAQAITLSLPCYKTSPAVSLGTVTATSTSPLVTGTGYSALQAAGSIYVGQQITSNRWSAGTTILSIDSNTQITLSAGANSTGSTAVTAGGEPQQITLLNKGECRNVQVAAKYYPESSGTVASAHLRLLGKYLTDNNNWQTDKAYGGASTTKGISTWKGLTASSDAVAGTSVTLGLPRMLKMRLFEDAILIKDWITYRLMRGTWDASKAWFKGEGLKYSATRAPYGQMTESYVVLNDIAAGAGPADPSTDTVNFLRCEEPDWQTRQRLRGGLNVGAGGSTSPNEDNVELGLAGLRSVYLTLHLYELSIIELERRPGNLFTNAQLEHIYQTEDRPLFFYSSGTLATIGTLTATATAGSPILTGVTGATATPVDDLMGLTSSRLNPGAKVVHYDAGAGTILMNVNAKSSGSTTVTMTNLADWTNVAGPGHQDPNGTPRRALRIRNSVAGASFICQDVYNAEVRTTSPFSLQRRRLQPAVMFPRSSEFVLYTRGVNLRNTDGTTLNAAFDLYNYNREGVLLQTWLTPSGAAAPGTYFYPLGPPAAHVQCTRNSATNVLTNVADTSKLSIGRSVTGAGIQNAAGATPNTWITAIDHAAKTVTLNQNPIASGTSTLDFGFKGGMEAGDGTGTWDWYPTKFHHIWRGNGQPVWWARLQFGFHANTLGDLIALDPSARPRGGQA